MKYIFLILSISTIMISCNDKKQNEAITSNKTDSIKVDKVQEKALLSPEERISEIKTWYEEAQKSLSSTSKVCKNNEEKWMANLDKDNTMEFTNKAQECTLPNGIKVYTGEFNGYEWQQKFIYYFKNDKLFFVYYESAAESCYDENRIYYDENQKPIQFLFKTNDCDGNDATDNKKIEDEKQQNDLIKIVDKHIVEIKRILEQKKLF